MCVCVIQGCVVRNFVTSSTIEYMYNTKNGNVRTRCMTHPWCVSLWIKRFTRLKQKRRIALVKVRWNASRWTI